MGMPQDRQYSNFLPESCSIYPISVWLGRLENGQLIWSNGTGMVVIREGMDAVSMQKTSYQSESQPCTPTRLTLF
jgi:hypothetical protein